MPHDELVARVAGKQALVSMITDAVDKAVIEAGTELKIIANAAVGYNNIDAAAARERGVIVTNTPGVLTDATADLTWALILGITRRIGEGERLVRRGGWKGWTFDFMLGVRAARQAAGDRRLRRHRPRRCGARPGVRHAHRLYEPHAEERSRR